MFFCLFLFIFGLLVKGLFFSSLDWWLVHLKKNLNKCYSKFNSKNTYTSVYFIFIKIIIFSPVSPWRWTPWPWCLTSGPTALPFSCASWSPSAVSQPLLCAWCQLSARVLGPISSLSRFPVLFSSMLVTIWAGRNSILMTLYFKHTLTQWPNIFWYSANHWALTSNKGILVTIRNYHCFFLIWDILHFIILDKPLDGCSGPNLERESLSWPWLCPFSGMEMFFCVFC